MTKERETTHSVGALLADFSEKIVGLPAAGEQTAVVDSDEYVRESLRRSSIERYNHICPPAYRDTNWTHPDLAPWQAEIDVIRNWKLTPRGIIASGPTGRGKTRAIWELYRRLTCEDVIDARFYYAGDWFSTLQQQINYGRDEAAGWVDAVASRRVVFIDDFGQEAMLANRSDWAAGWFFRFLDLRVGRGLPLIVSTNLGASGFGVSTGKGDPLLRRLLEICEPIRFTTQAERELTRRNAA